jgi:cytosine/creatinine deaminase
MTAPAVAPEVARALLDRALAEAERGAEAGGMPIGAVLGTPDGEVVSCGHNQRLQTGDVTRHAEIVSVANAPPETDFTACVLATTLAPCWMCAGMVRFLGVSALVIGDTDSWQDGAVAWLRGEGLAVVELHDSRCRALLEAWLREHGGWPGEVPVA